MIKDIPGIKEDLARIRESIDAGHLPEESFQNYIDDLEDPWQHMIVLYYKGQVLERLKEFNS